MSLLVTILIILYNYLRLIILVILQTVIPTNIFPKLFIFSPRIRKNWIKRFNLLKLMSDNNFSLESSEVKLMNTTRGIKRNSAKYFLAFSVRDYDDVEVLFDGMTA